jgi:diguanylate cyclase (GGDEF)-like protein/PAS domain S-box-containing protein
MELKPEIYEQIVNNVIEGVYLTNTDRVIIYWNEPAERITGYTAEEVVGKSCADNILRHVDDQGNNLCGKMCPLSATMSDRVPREAKVYLHHKDGHRLPVLVNVSPLTNETGIVIGGVEVFTDVSNQEANRLRLLELEQLAMLDPLTELANRRYMERALASSMEEWSRYQTPFGLLFIDIDHFKAFNDTYGHDVGDEVLKFVAKTLSSNARPFDIFGRWGGEEFVGILRNVSGDMLREISQRLLQLVRNAYIQHQNLSLHVTVSIGATLVKDKDTVESLLQRADELMYQSKKAGRDRVVIG